MAAKLITALGGARLRDGLLLVAGLALSFLIMAYRGRIPHGALWGGLGVILALVATLRWMGLLAPLSEEQRTSLPSLWQTCFAPLPGERSWFAPQWAVPLAVLLVGVGLVFPSWLPGALTLALVGLLPAGLRRPGLLLMTLVGLLYLPGLGTFGLWDPWETHYGEVAREILSRNDGISLWWAQDGWFWSKPILIFWAEALTWSALGIDYRPDSQFWQAEWAVRLPVCLLSLAAVLAVYAVVRRLWDQRTGFVCGVVLATAPFFALLSHQAITDMYFVANMTVAMACLLAAFTVDGDQQVRIWRVGRCGVSAQHLVIGLLFLVAVPQILYLTTRNASLMDGPRLVLHADAFMQGSAGNVDVPGNGARTLRTPVFDGWLAQPACQAFWYGLGLVGLLWGLCREQRARPLLMVAFYVFCALALMGKGIPGIALPGAVAGLWLLLRNRWSLLLQGELSVARGIAIIATLGLPWFVAEYIRQGTRFTDRLLIHDHINRLTLGVHGDTGSIQYFIAHLGYGMFPWVALAPLAVALLAAQTPAKPGPEAVRQRDGVLLLGLWFCVAFTLFSAMTTKFHHYIFPAVPAAALLVGLALAQMMGKPVLADAAHGASAKWKTRFGVGLLCACLAPCLLIIGSGGLRGNLRGRVPLSVPEELRADWVLEHGLHPVLAVACIVAAVALMLLAAWLQAGRWQPERLLRGAGLGAALLCGAVLAGFVGRDLAWFSGERPAGNERLIQLFIYKYERPFPDDFDYRGLWTGVACTVVVLCLCGALRSLRTVAAQGLLALSVVFAGFVLNVHIPDLSAHWSQRGLVKRYYEERADATEALVAWQMNWKGENFYTGNRVAVFQALDNKEIREYMEANEGHRAFFILEHKRLKRFRQLMGDREVAELSTKHDNNKFVLVRALL